jgi:hypothetical protein
MPLGKILGFSTIGSYQPFYGTSMQSFLTQQEGKQNWQLKINFRFYLAEQYIGVYIYKMKDGKIVKKPTITIKVYKDGLQKVRKHVEKTGQTVVAFYSLAAEKELKATTQN